MTARFGAVFFNQTRFAAKNADSALVHLRGFAAPVDTILRGVNVLAREGKATRETGGVACHP